MPATGPPAAGSPADSPLQRLVDRALGIALGNALAMLLARSLSALLYGLEAADPWSHLAGVGLIGLVAALASVLPAQGAARVGATVALRSE